MTRLSRRKAVGTALAVPLTAGIAASGTPAHAYGFPDRPEVILHVFRARASGWRDEGPCAGATVELVNVATGRIDRSGETDGRGMIRFTRLPVGATYALNVTWKGLPGILWFDRGRTRTIPPRPSNPLRPGLAKGDLHRLGVVVDMTGRT